MFLVVKGGCGDRPSFVNLALHTKNGDISRAIVFQKGVIVILLRELPWFLSLFFATLFFAKLVKGTLERSGKRIAKLSLLFFLILPIYFLSYVSITWVTQVPVIHGGVDFQFLYEGALMDVPYTNARNVSTPTLFAFLKCLFKVGK